MADANTKATEPMKIGGVSFTAVAANQNLHPGYVFIDAVVSPDDVSAPFDPAKGKVAQQVFSDIEMMFKKENPRYLVMRNKDDAGTSGMGLWIKGAPVEKQVRRAFRRPKTVTEAQDAGLTLEKAEWALQKLQKYYGEKPEAPDGDKPRFAEMLDAQARMRQRFEQIVQDSGTVPDAVRQSVAAGMLRLVDDGAAEYQDTNVARRGSARQSEFAAEMEDRILAAMEANGLKPDSDVERERLVAALKAEVMDYVRSAGKQQSVVS